MTARAIATLAALGVVGLVGCGGSSEESSVPGGADPDSIEVIRDWADDLRGGDIEAASDAFAVPSVVQNGTPPLQLANRRQVEAFNRSLPCGAELTRAERSGRFTVATFELTERPGPGRCGPGVGQTAQTAFVIHDGRITEWRRVADLPTESPSQGPVI
jgi:hypothetical protein